MKRKLAAVVIILVAVIGTLGIHFTQGGRSLSLGGLPIDVYTYAPFQVKKVACGFRLNLPLVQIDGVTHVPPVEKCNFYIPHGIALSIVFWILIFAVAYKVGKKNNDTIIKL